MGIQFSNELNYRRAISEARASAERVIGTDDLTDFVVGTVGIIFHGVAARAHVPARVYVQEHLRADARAIYDVSLAAGDSSFRAGVQATISCLTDLTFTAGVKATYIGLQVAEAVYQR